MTTISTNRNGILCFTIFSSDCFDMPWATNKFMPSGEVRKPMTSPKSPSKPLRRSVAPTTLLSLENGCDVRHVQEMVAKNRCALLIIVKSPRYNPTSTRGFELWCSALQLARFVAESLHRFTELLNLQWLLQNCDRTHLKFKKDSWAVPRSTNQSDPLQVVNTKS